MGSPPLERAAGEALPPIGERGQTSVLAVPVRLPTRQ